MTGSGGGLSANSSSSVWGTHDLFAERERERRRKTPYLVLAATMQYPSPPIATHVPPFRSYLERKAKESVHCSDRSLFKKEILRQLSRSPLAPLVSPHRGSRSDAKRDEEITYGLQLIFSYRLSPEPCSKVPRALCLSPISEVSRGPSLKMDSEHRHRALSEQRGREGRRECQCR